MKKHILSLKGALLLTKNQQKNIIGGADLTKYEEGNPCQEWTEIVPRGCPCSSQFSCSGVYYQDSSNNTQYRDGVCVNGTCA